MAPASLDQALKSWAKVVSDHTTLKLHRWTYRVPLPHGLAEELKIGTVFRSPVRLRLQSHDLPRQNTKGENITFLVVGPSESNFGCHYKMMNQAKKGINVSGSVSGTSIFRATALSSNDHGDGYGEDLLYRGVPAIWVNFQAIVFV